MPRRRVLELAAEIEILYPQILDRVTLFGIDFDDDEPRDTQPYVFAESVTRQGGPEREFVEFYNLPVVNHPDWDGHLQVVADRMRMSNDGRYKIYRVRLEELTDEEMNDWAGIGIGDEIVMETPIDPAEVSLLPPITQVREYEWNCTGETGYNLTLFLEVHPQALPDTGDTGITTPLRALWEATITWGHDDDSDDSGYDAPGGANVYGDITSRDIDTDGDGTDDVQLDAFKRLDDGRIRIVVGTAEEYNRLEGKYFQITNIALFPIWFVVPTDPDNVGNTPIQLIPESEVPAEGVQHFAGVSLWDTLPPGATLTEGLVALPSEVGVQRDTAVASLQAAGFTVVVTTEEDDSNIGDVIRSIPAHGTSVRPGSEVTLVVGVAVPVQTVAVPDLSGLEKAAAETAITNAGLVPSGTAVISTVQATDQDVQTQNPPAGTQVAPGSTVSFTYLMYEAPAPPSPEPQKLRDMVLTWGDHSGNTPRHGFSLAPPDDEAYGALTNRTFDVGDVVVEIRRLAELGNPGQDPPDPNEGAIRIDVGNHEQAEALAGNWIRLEPTDDIADDVVFQVPEPEGTRSWVQTPNDTFPSADVPPTGTQFAVSVWDLQPVGIASTPNLPIAAVTVPDTTDDTVPEARTAITDLGLVVGTVSVIDETSGIDDAVIRTEPAAGASVAAGSTVNLFVRNLQATVPDVRGFTRAAAVTALEADGFVVGTDLPDVDTGTQADNNLVQATQPAHDAVVDYGSTVRIALWNYVAVVVPDPVELWRATLTVDSSGDWSGYYVTDDYGELSDTVAEDIGDSDVDVTIARIDWNPSTRDVRFWAGDAAQATALSTAQVWLRVELTNADAGDAISSCHCRTPEGPTTAASPAPTESRRGPWPRPTTPGSPSASGIGTRRAGPVPPTCPRCWCPTPTSRPTQRRARPSQPPG